MRHLVETHLADDAPRVVADLGSYDVNGSYRPLFKRPGWRYTGIDLGAGPNVDVVLDSPYRFPLASNSVDVFVSGQAFEHVEYFWLTWMEMVRSLRPGGMIFLIAPSRGPEHRYPVDCWRFYPDGFAALAKYAGMELVQVATDWQAAPEEDSAPWGDTVGVFRKPHRGGLLRRRVLTLATRLMAWAVRSGR
jgi:SAM-dependent methyltransferase